MAELQDEDDIAIIGMSCRVAGAHSTSQLWDNLVSSKDVQSNFEPRFSTTGYYNPDGGARKGLTNVKNAYLIDQDLSKFDAEFFSISPLEAASMDPQQRLLLELAYETIENSGIPAEQIRGSDTGVFTGISGIDYAASLLRDIDTLPKYTSTGISNALASNRISYAFDLSGPNFAIDTACSSSMVALHQARLSLQAKECGMAIVCGANLVLAPDMFVHMSELGILSPNGRCRSFDIDADGYARGEGVVAIMLKPLKHALRDNDAIRAVLRGTGINQDGKTQGITQPSKRAQILNMQQTYHRFHVDAGDVQYLEAHGTGTRVGDATEVSAISSVYSAAHEGSELVVGSIKSNIGHLEASAALAGIVKVVESLEHALITPQMNLTKLNPDLECNNILVPTTTLPWPTSSGVRRAAINSFGYGGTNGHAILESFPKTANEMTAIKRPLLLKVSAASKKSLKSSLDALARYIEFKAPKLHDLAYTLLARRSTFNYTTFLTANTPEDLLQKLRSDDLAIQSPHDLCHSEIGFVFTGQGSQWPGMGSTLIKQSPLFALVIAACDQVLQSLPDAPEWHIADELSKKEDSQVYQPEFSQPLCTVIQLGLIQLWESLSITPQMVVGHSSGEIGAAFTAGFISLRDAVIIAYYRGYFIRQWYANTAESQAGAMCAVGMREEDCLKLLAPYRGRVDIAAINSPTSCTISGDLADVDDIVEICKERGTFCRKLRVDAAYHSHHMLRLAASYKEALVNAGVTYKIGHRPSPCTMYSSVYSRSIIAEECTPEYWMKNLVSTVRFAGALTQAANSQKLGVIIEIGPHPALKGPAEDTLVSLGGDKIAYLSSCVRGKDDYDAHLDTVSQLILAGIPVDLAKVNSEDHIGDRQGTSSTNLLTDLPPYCWDHSVSHWGESRVALKHRNRDQPRHELLGTRISFDNDLARTWRNRLSRKELNFLHGLKNYERHLRPSLFIMMAIEAARQIRATGQISSSSVKISKLHFPESISLFRSKHDESILETHFLLRQLENQQTYAFEISASSGESHESWKCCCTGEIIFSKSNLSDMAPSHFKNSELLDASTKCQINAFYPLECVEATSNELSGQIAAWQDTTSQYSFDPILLNSLFATIEACFKNHLMPGKYLLQSIESVEFPAGDWCLGDASLNMDFSACGPGQGKATCRLQDYSGQIMTAGGLHFSFQPDFQEEMELGSLFLQPQWRSDLALQKPFDRMPISTFLQLLTHKSPMCDIGLLNVGESISNSMIVEVSKLGKRAAYRSITVVDSAKATQNNKIRYVDDLDEDLELDLLFAKSADIANLDSRVRRDGFVCVDAATPETRAYFSEHFLFLGQIDGLQGNVWLLGKPKVCKDTTTKPSQLKVVATSGIQSQQFHHFLEASVLTWEQLIQQESLPKTHQSGETFDLIVFDYDSESNLLALGGAEILPRIHLALDRVGILLWVTKGALENPFNDVAGSLLRTIANEHPTMKCASICVEDTIDVLLLGEYVKDTYNSLLNGSREGEFKVRDGSLQVLRYLPNDRLSASVGLTSPIESTHTTGQAYHEVSILSSLRPELLVDHSAIQPPCHRDEVLIEVEMSAIDHLDVMTFMGQTGEQQERPALGMFCAGFVSSTDQTHFDRNTRVVAWQPGAHRSELTVPLAQLCRIPQELNSAQALALYAVSVTASAALHHHARVRPGDTVRFNGTGLLTSSLRSLCRRLEVDVVEDYEAEADFTIQYEPRLGLTVNGRSITQKDYLRATQSDIPLITSELEMNNMISQVKVWSLSQLRPAFEAAQLRPCSTILDHRSEQRVEGSILRYKPNLMKFRPDGTYVVLGGLGGLGRFLCQWMIQNGARHIVTISRSGSGSDEAIETIDAIHNLGGKLEAVQADASKQEDLQTALSQIRRSGKIYGCVNMAMVVDDGPIAKMQPNQWDRVLEAKVQTSWNLHQATVDDDLDFFIMFSSLASVLGNRMQSNYAVGNAFQNSLARYRRALNLPGVAVALGPMTEIGVLSNDNDLIRTYINSGLRPLTPSDFVKLFEGALIESRLRYAPGVIGTGMAMFPSVNGRIQCKPEQSQIFWSGMPEFSHLFDHCLDANNADQDSSIKEQLSTAGTETGLQLLAKAFLKCLSGMLGLDPATTDTNKPLSQYGLDSLNALSCRYWFFQELGVDMTIFDILGCRSINELISRAVDKFFNTSQSSGIDEMPVPTHNPDCVTRPLSHSQKRLWFLQNVMSDKTALNLLLVCHIKGSVDLDKFQAAWSLLLARHEVLRSKIVETECGPQQVPLVDAQFNLAEIRADDQSFEAESSALKSFATAYEFDLEAGELVRGWLLRSQSRTAFFLASHHLAWDRQSAPTAFEETSKIYRDLVSESPPTKSLNPVPYQFVDYALWQQSCLEMDSITKPHIDYWKEQLAGAPEAVALLPIATSPDRPSEKQDRTGNFSCVIPPALSDSLRSFCAEKATTPFMFMASAISIAMYRLTGDADVVLGIPDGDRGHSDFDSLIGFTVNMLPIRCKLEAPDMSYNDYLEHYRRTCLEAYEHRILPFDMLIQELDLSRQSSHNPLFQITVNYQIQGAYPRYDHGSFEMVDYEHYNAKHQTDLSLDIEEYPDGSLKCDFEFDSELYTLEGVKSFAETYVQLISSVVEQRGVQEIGEIRIVPDAHLQTIANSLHPPITDNPLRDQSALLFNELFEKAVIKHEEKEALVDSASTVSYKSLLRLTNRVANSLLMEGIETGSRVAIMCQPSILMMLAIYGALRAGCVYVPIDADSPVDRLKLILDDVDIKHAIVDGLEYSDRLVKGGVPAENIFFIADISSAGVDEGKPTPTRPVSPDDGFCCIFTSGSTGRPKGIEIRQLQLRLQMEGYNDAIATSSEDRILLSAATVFDMSLPAIFGTILRGATMCIASSELRYSAAEMVDFIIDQQVSSCVFTPTQLKFMLTSNKREKLQQWQSLKSMVVGGEALTSWLVHKFYNLELCHAVLYDGYGPTEATVANSIRRVLPEDADSGYVAIGGPTFPAQFYILDKSMSEVPLGFPGELYIGGPTVSQGYIKREVLSQQVFVDNIFASEKDREQGYGTLYRSGDCFSLDHRGLLRFHGRVAGDRQVKIRGKRTELNEIENVIWSICQSSSISKATSVTGVAILYHQPKGADAEVLISYLAIGSANLQLDDKRQLFSELRKDLAAKLPMHMTPSICVFVPELPSTVTGKMDYKRIQTWDVSEAIYESDLQRSTAANGSNLPPMQLAMSNIWQRVLQTDTTYHPQSDFFALGGHSLLLFQIQTEIKKEFGVKVSIAALFGTPTIEKMTDMVHEYVAYISDDSDQHDDSSRQSCNSSPVQDSDSINGPIINGHSSSIDWQKELSLPLERTLNSSTLASTPASVVALTGASKMIGAYILRLLLPAKHIQKVYCLAEEAADEDAAYRGVIASLTHWKADRGIPKEAYKKLTVLSGSLRHETLGLDNSQIDVLDRDVQAIYNLAADVSLFKNYTSLRAGNVGCLRFLINLAASHRIGNVKQLHHLSTWGVSHLQSWTSTQISETSGVLRGEEELSNMSPGPEDGLGYLKTRWACEALLYRAAELGLPVSIYRSCLCSGSRNPGVALDRSDTNRRTIAGFLAVGMVPDFGSAQGGGMSWISADYLAGAITFLANKEGGEKKNGYKSINGERHGKKNKAGKAKIYNVVSDKHHEYAQLCEMLNASGRLKAPLRLVEPKEWFTALRALGTQEMIMHADVLESWWEAGWTPFGLKGDDTLDLLRQEARLKAPHVDGNFLLDLVVGSE